MMYSILVLKIDSIVFFFLHGLFGLKYADSSNQSDFFFTMHSFYEYAQSNQSNTHDHKKLSPHDQTLFFNVLLFFLASLFLIY